MRFRLHVNQDLVAGLMFLAWGIVGLWLGQRYSVGTSLRMGPGYLPSLLCWCLIVLGLVIAIKGASVEGEKLTKWHFRPLILVLAGLGVFGLLIERGGLPAAAIGCTLVGALGSPEFRFWEVLILGVCLAVVGVGVFVYGLGLPMNIWPSF
jgi:putative tricarboxylic transport membrane protein